MASIIKLKRSTTPGQVPSSLETGELAINLADKKLYSYDGSSIISVSGDQYNLTTSSGDGGAVLNLTVDNASLSNDAIELLGGDGVTITRNANGSITFDAAITSGLIADEAITTAKLADGAVTATKIAAGTITANLIANDSVALGTKTTGNYVSGVSAGQDIEISGSGSENATVTVALADNIAANTTGNAATATALQTARTIGGVSFDGTANINLPGVNTTGNQDTTGNAATATALATARTIGGVSFDGSANIDLPGVNTAGNQDTSGNAATATKLATARTIQISGDQAGSASFDGSGNINIAVTTQNDSVDLGTHTTGNYVATVSGTSNEIVVSGSGSETAAVTVGLADNVTVPNNLTVTANTSIGGNLTVEGNLDVNGTLTYINSTTVTIGDNLLKLANTNSSDSVDIGWYGLYNSSGNKYAGMVRDATDGTFYLFRDLSDEPDQQIDFGNASLATLNAVIDGGTY